MTEDEIIELACQTFGGIIKKEERKNFLAFAKLVAEAEREACAKIVEESSLPDTYSEACLLDISNEIRARGNES